MNDKHLDQYSSPVSAIEALTRVNEGLLGLLKECVNMLNYHARTTHGAYRVCSACQRNPHMPDCRLHDLLKRTDAVLAESAISEKGEANA